jgi:glycosyltransferase involved in cell wall biosynthesis
MLKISIITPCLNSLDLLKETTFSVLNQKTYLDETVELEYIIYDGGSQDGTRQWVDRLNHPAVKFFSEKDKGVYDAIAKGFESATGDIVAYLNCGDYYGPYTFSILNEVFSKADVKWITGYNTWYNQKGYMISANLPYRYRRDFIYKGIYGHLMPIQQESTFWQRELLEYIDMKRLSQFKLAGDYYLWQQFSRIAELKIVKAYLSGFRKHSGQLSENKLLYKAELKEIIKQPTNMLDYIQILFDLLIWYLPDRLKLTMNREIIIP